MVIATQSIAIRALVLMATTMLVGIGCSSQSDSTQSNDDDGIRSFIAAYNDAINSGSAKDRWDMTCESQREWLNADPVRKEQLKDSVPGQLEPKQITVNGDSALVVIDHINGSQRDSTDLNLAREHGSWKICEK